MDIYHEVLTKLFDLSEGKAGKNFDFVKLVKDLGLRGNYVNIYDYLNRKGWIVESTKEDFVGITPFGIIEVRKFRANGGENEDAEDTFQREVRKTISTAQDLVTLLEASEQTPHDARTSFSQVEKKFTELQGALNQLKDNLP